MTDRLSGMVRPDRARIRDALERRLGIDARALAAFRIILGLTLLFDVLHRSRHLVTFYTDSGAVPREVRLAQADVSAQYSIHMLSGEPWAQALLFGLAALLAIGVLVGYRTQLAVLLSLVLLVSVHFRAPLVLNSGDRLLREVMVLAVFLPLGTRWAVDAIGSDRERNRRVATPATAAILLYVVSFFANNGQHKRLGDTWPGGEALQYALRQDQLTILLGNYLVDYPLLLEVGTYGWLALVVGAPLLLVLSGWLRVLYVGLFLSAVAGLGLSMAVGLFPAVLTAVLVLFVPTRVWDRLETAGASHCRRVEGLERLRARTSALGSQVGPPRRLHSTLSPQTSERKRQLWSVVLGFVLLVVVVWNIGLLGYADTPEMADPIDPEDNQWTMYAPDPSTTAGWYVVEAHLESGERMDVLRNDDLRDGPPPDASDSLPSFRWRKYMSSLDDDTQRADRFGASMCDRAAEQFDTPVERIEVVYYSDAIDFDAEESSPTATTRVETACSAA
ncbi:HTTM domain-containing protein [Natronorubrum thiooxidans]|uniref:Vitamin K-dependent gamma-carboxylase n=1 Tax=Natronorubrum thiooxidans TaxID=308853 RepID=A0A1N7DMX6_9EURY|nr:HTTM domain-containing protein [Natronorubrum thiooxidans]SIR77209.1 Vitamin K-dependent gamma-carboxylase [Natronorubrum thiooxidans]